MDLLSESKGGRDPEGPLTEYERYLVDKIFSPENLPKRFKEYLLDYIPVNGNFDKASLVGAAALGGMAHLETKRLSADGPSFDFTVPQGYTHLRLIGEQDNTSGAHGIDLQFNGDTSAVYNWTEQGYLPGTGRTDAESLAQAGIRIGVSYNQVNSGWAPVEATIFDYAQATQKRTLATYGAYDGAHHAIRQSFGSYGLATPVPVTSLKVIVNGGFNFRSGSVFSLYGLV